MKKNYKLKIVCLLCIFTALFSNCKKSDLVEEQGLSNKHNGLASAGDGQNDLLGYGYDVTGEYANSSASKFLVIDIARLKSDQPTRVEWDLSSKKFGEVIAGENALSYLKSLTDKLGANLSIQDPDAKPSADGKTPSIPLFKGSIQSSSDNSSFYSSKYIYSSYSLKIQQKRVKLNAENELLKQYLTQSFINDVQNNSPQAIVSAYGTHILKDIVLGAKLDVLYTSETTKSDVKTAASSGIEFNILGIFGFNTSQTSNTQKVDENTNQRLIFKAIGGEPSPSLFGNIPLGSTLPNISTQAWENSSSLLNAEMIDISEGGLIPIWDLIADATKSAAVKSYVISYLLASKVKLSAVPIYRYFNPTNGDHLYSKVNTTVGNYISEGSEFNAYPNLGVQNTVPVFRYYNATNGDHLYSRGSPAPGGYISEGIAFYAFASEENNSTPIYRYFNPNSGDHFYAKTANAPAGYIAEGVSFYAPN